MTVRKQTAGTDGRGAGKWERGLANYVSRRMQDTKTPSVSIALVRGEKIVYSRGFGSRCVEKLLPSDGNTLYGIGSITKSFTALAIMQLQEKGLLNVHDRIGKHLPEFGQESVLGQTEIYHLLTHSSGLPTLNVAEVALMREFGTDTSFVPLGRYEDFIDLVEASESERVAPPGKKFLYWNEGYTILGKIVEKASGERYTEYIKKHILEPLGMGRSGFGEELTSRDDNAATFYNRSADGKIAPTALKAQEMDVAAGGLITSPVELCNYLRMMMSGGSLGSRKVVSSKLLGEMTTDTIDEEQPSEFGDAFYGYGWSVVEDFFGHRLVSHGGDVGVSSAYAAFIPDLGIGVAVECNAGDGPMSNIGLYALACMIGKRPEEELRFVAAQNLSERIAGEYTDYRHFTTLTVTPWGPGFLKAEYKSGEMVFSMPLIIEDGLLYTINNYSRFALPYRTLPDGRMELLFERHRFVRK